MKKMIFAVILATVSSLTVNAQKWALNGALDNLYVEIGGGVNGVLDNGTFNTSSPAFNVNLGKWFTPSIGLAFGYTGITNRSADSANGWFAGDGPFSFHLIHADAMWRWTNTFFGYNERRVVNSSIYATAGIILAGSGMTSIQELASGAGLNVTFRLTSRLSAKADARIVFAREEAFRPDAGKAIAFTTFSGGVVFDFGVKTHTWSPYKYEVEIHNVPVVIQKDCDHDHLIKALQAERDSLLARAPKEKIIDHYIHDGHVTYFVIDKWDILPRETFHLMDLVASLPAGATLSLVGHADKETGSARRNEKLSRNRVSVVAEKLRELGFQGKIITDWKGDTANPFNGNAPKNRCVTIQVTL